MEVPTSLSPGWRMVFFLGSEAYRKIDAPAGTCSSGRCRWRWCRWCCCWRGCDGGGGQIGVAVLFAHGLRKI
jgi:hypothetical protein